MQNRTLNTFWKQLIHNRLLYGSTFFRGKYYPTAWLHTVNLGLLLLF